jgi:amidase
VGPMAADVAGLILGMQLLEPGFAVAGAGPLRVGRLRVPAAPQVDDAVTEALRATSWEVSYVDPDDWRAATRWTATLLVAEAYQTNKEILERYADRISPDVARRLDDGRQAAPAAVAAAADGRVQWQAQLAALFDRFDLLVTPTLAILPPTLDRATELLDARYTMPVNLAGVPALALPIPARGRLPASIQLISASGTEDRLLAAGAAIEAAIAG